jgi:hypothetical protein
MSLRHRVFLASLLLLAASAWFGTAAFAQDDNKDDLLSDLEQVGGAYAEGYLAPLSNALGANQNSALFYSAHVPGAGLTFGIAAKFMGSHMSEDDKTFRQVVEVDDLSTIDPSLPHVAGFAVLEGPSVIGDSDTPGTITGYVNGIPVGPPVEGISGLVDTRWIPLATPEFSVGGIVGAKLTIRWVPEMDLGKVGKTKYFGWGLQFSPNHFMPTLPLDLSVGFFKQQMDIGTVLETDAQSIFVAASKGFGMATIYGGYAKEESTLKVDYVREGTGTRVSFETDSIMENRFTLGATLNLGLKMYAEAGFGELSVYSAGFIFEI